GIAHDLNNVLSPIIMANTLLSMRLGDMDSDSKRILNVISTSAERGRDIVMQVLSFARGAPGRHIILQPSYVIKELLKILRETLPKSIEIKFFVPSDLYLI